MKEGKTIQDRAISWLLFCPSGLYFAYLFSFLRPGVVFSVRSVVSV